MGIFNKNKETEEVELFYEMPNEQTFHIKNAKAIVRIDDYFIRISRKNTLTNLLLHGLDGEKSILLSEITAYQLKEPDKTVGYLQIIYPGSSDVKGGVTAAVNDENTIIFRKEDKAQILELKKAIETALIKKHQK